MKFLQLLFCYCLLSLKLFSQDIKKYVVENTWPVTSIDTSSNEYNDLEAIGSAIGDARVVMLGEQDHGDAPAFLAKARLIRYLHEKKGFNVLAFESDFYGLTTGWDELSKQPDLIREFLKRNIFSYWTRSDACHHLFETYIPNSFETKIPLQVTGFDSQLYLEYSFEKLKNGLNLYLTGNNLTSKFTDENYKTFLNAVQGLTAYNMQPDVYKNINRKVLKEGLDLIKTEQLEKKDSSYWSLIIDNMISFINNSNTNRDKAMADNLKYLVNKKYKDEKIIVWSANSHIIKYTDQLKSTVKNFDQVIWKNMGTNFINDPAVTAKTYILGFTSYDGTAGRLWSNSFSVEKPNKNGLENWISKEVPYAFVDFTLYNQKFGNPEKAFLMKAPSHFTIMSKFAKVPWNLVYDGVFFVRNMYPVQLDQ